MWSCVWACFKRQFPTLGTWALAGLVGAAVGVALASAPVGGPITVGVVLVPLAQIFAGAAVAAAGAIWNLAGCIINCWS
jgi:hypothetical protein